MEIIRWIDNYSVNILEIDNQHKRLVTLLNNLYAAMSVGEGKNILSGIIDELSEYTSTHFRTEEVKMRMLDYPEFVQHKKEHEMFIQKVGAFRADFNKGNAKVTIEVVNFLRDWLLNHIQEVDARLGKYLVQKGVK